MLVYCVLQLRLLFQQRKIIGACFNFLNVLSVAQESPCSIRTYLDWHELFYNLGIIIVGYSLLKVNLLNIRFHGVTPYNWYVTISSTCECRGQGHDLDLPGVDEVWLCQCLSLLFHWQSQTSEDAPREIISLTLRRQLALLPNAGSNITIVGIHDFPH